MLPFTATFSSLTGSNVIAANEISEDDALRILEQAGRRISCIHRIQEGANHCIFDLVLENGQEAICKFPKIRTTEASVSQNTDTLFGGPLSPERERAIFTLVREQAGLPAPEIFAVEDSPWGKFILLEKMSGVSHKEFLKRQGYTQDAFLRSMVLLGKDFAMLHKAIRFECYGDFIGPGHILPGNNNFSDRFLAVTKMRIYRAYTKKMFSEKEAERISSFFTKGFGDYKARFSLETAPPTLVFTDMHGDNFFVDTDGKPSGYFDLESAQAAPGALEFYGLRFFLFNFFDEMNFHRAEESFFTAYEEAGGPYAPHNSEENGYIDFLAASRLLEISQSYWGYKDGLRDTWGERIYRLFQQYMDDGTIDYMALGAVWRERDHQPERPF
jgi:hypothetical protein